MRRLFRVKEMEARLKELERLNAELIAEKNRQDELDYAWTGSLGRWYWDFESNTVVFNPLKVLALGYSTDEIPEKIGFQFFTEKLHPEDYDRTMQIMRDHLSGKTDVYETEYRIKTKSGDYKWYYDRGKVTKRDKSGKPLFIAGIVFDITDRKKLESELEKKNLYLAEISERDSLTGLYNHRYIYENLEIMIRDDKYHPLCVAVLDLDNFKSLNDEYGHIHGDRVLQRVTELIKADLHPHDIAGRYGGDEFVVIFPNRELQNVKTICQKICASVSGEYASEKIKLTLSCGIAVANEEDARGLIHKADMNMYEAKAAGKNRVVFATDVAKE